MSWRALRVPLFVGIGLAAPGLVVLTIQTVPRDLIVFRTTKVEPPRVFQPSAPVMFAKAEPVKGLDPFRTVLPKAPKPPVAAIPQPPTQWPGAALSAPIVLAQQPILPVPSVPEPLEEIPDPKLEGVVAGEDPVAVIKFGEESQFVRVGQKLSNGLQVLSITEGEVRLKHGTRELVLKTGIR